MDDDLQAFDCDALIAEVKKLRAGIRQHRCIRDRQSLDGQAWGPPVHDKEFNG